MGRPEIKSDHGQTFDDHQKINFRLLARALAKECKLTMDEWRKSCRAIETCRRRQVLPFNFHAEVVGLSTPELQDQALDWAEERLRTHTS